METWLHFVTNLANRISLFYLSGREIHMMEYVIAFVLALVDVTVAIFVNVAIVIIVDVIFVMIIVFSVFVIFTAHWAV